MNFWDTTLAREITGGLNLKILVWGLGYVGSVTANCLAQLGYEVIGIEPSDAKTSRAQFGLQPGERAGWTLRQRSGGGRSTARGERGNSARQRRRHFTHLRRHAFEHRWQPDVGLHTQSRRGYWERIKR